MKKLMVLVLALIPATMAFAGIDNDKPVAFNDLPTAAKQFIERFFPDARVSLATVDKELFSTTYDVIFTDGTKIEFDSDGRWSDIDCKHSFVPKAALPARIAAYLTEHHPDANVREIDRDRWGYELQLDNHFEISFDSRGNLRGYDD